VTVERAVRRRRGVYVALLRGINVGGKNRLPMKRLIEVFTTLAALALRSTSRAAMSSSSRRSDWPVRFRPSSQTESRGVSGFTLRW
jgi:energy-coupling factor transporter transmembrane protein EcfT